MLPYWTDISRAVSSWPPHSVCITFLLPHTDPTRGLLNSSGPRPGERFRVAFLKAQ